MRAESPKKPKKKPRRLCGWSVWRDLAGRKRANFLARGEISGLWEAGKFPAKSILLVTHNIEEAVLLSDRVVILGANPRCIRGELEIDIPRPRNNRNPRFATFVNYIYTVMTNPNVDVGRAPTTSGNARFSLLPHTRVGGMSGLLEIIADQGGREDLPKLAERLRLEVDDLLPTVDAAVLLGFAELFQGDVIITREGQTFASSEAVAGLRPLYFNRARCAEKKTDRRRQARVLRRHPRWTLLGSEPKSNWTP